MPGYGRPTSKDVAQAAGVSQSTVSLVLAGKWRGRVSPGTARTVHETAERLGYRPNLAARNLRLGTTRTVMLMVPTLNTPFFGSVYTGAARVATAHGFGVVVYPLPEIGRPADNPFATPHEAIDGILASSMPLEVLREFHGTPAVMLDSDPAGAAPTVDFDVAGAMREIVAHLEALGHRRIGHLAAGLDEWTFWSRGAALAEAVARVPGGELIRVNSAFDVPHGRQTAARQAATELLDRPDRPTAVVCDADLLAAGMYKAAHSLGLRIPGDLSIASFDDMVLATALEPEMTTVRLPAEELGAQGMSTLLELLDGGSPASRSLPGELIIRSSTAPPKDEP